MTWFPFFGARPRTYDQTTTNEPNVGRTSSDGTGAGKSDGKKLYNPRNVTFKVTPSIHVDATVTIVLESGEELRDMYDHVFSYEPSEIARHGRDLIERYNRMMDLSETIR